MGGPPSGARRRDRLRSHHRQPHPPRRQVHALARRQGAQASAISRSCVPDPAAAHSRRSGCRADPPEVYASGLRNPYRWSFDRQTGDLYVGDVGGTNEEVTFVPAAQARGANLGWNCFSGTAVESGCAPSNYFPPSYQYPSSPDVVIGGYVVRDPALPSFAGRYLFGRYDSGNIISLGPNAAPPAVDTNLDVDNVSGFGEDGAGHLYATSLAGEVYRLGESGGVLTKTSIGPFAQPLAVSAAPGVTDELFVAEKPGRLMRWTPSGTNEVLDIRSLVQDGRRAGTAVGGRRAGLRRNGARLRLLRGQRRGPPGRRAPRGRPHTRADDPARPGLKPQRRPAAVRPGRRALPVDR